MTNKKLRQLYTEHDGKVSDKWSLYLDEYEKKLNSYINKKINLLEIGIQNGGSLEIWSKYFREAKKFVGCDINPDCSNLTYQDPRINLVIGDANSSEILKEIQQHSPKFDIIIDDGSHNSSDIIKSFSLYFPLLEEGGIFIVEDLHCSYWDRFEGGLFDTNSSISFFKKLIDIVNYQHWSETKLSQSDFLNEFFKKYNCDITDEALSQVHSIEFINSICVIHKAPIENNELGSRIISGTLESVVKGHLALKSTAITPKHFP